ncbi:hypothetical protein [Streptomyces sp. CoH27]|uniref:hypothetical protein n=1 Tax=Streptomyces sp. CoH27 TaxID=2875763 RepID=UPI0027DF68BE|nr:hypothetical protein [Streptomyces sp. CoH27]
MRPPRLDGYDDLLRPLLERCLAADPDQRIGTEELAALCEQTAGRRLNDFTGRRCPTRSPRTSSPPSRLSSPCPRSRPSSTLTRSGGTHDTAGDDKHTVQPAPGRFSVFSHGARSRAVRRSV